MKFIIFFLFAVISVALANDDNEKRTFRHGQTQQVWEKAQRKQLEPSMSNSLFHELKDYDKRIMEWKKLKHSGHDDDGNLEAELRIELKAIMVKYGIISKERAFPNEQGNYNKKDYTKNKGSKFYHKELDKLWQAALDEGSFTEDELMTLEVEFHHHKDKIFEYDALRNTVEESKGDSDAHPNEVDGFESITNKQKLDKMSRDVKEGFERLHLKMGNKRDGSEVPFTEPRVASLWNIAKNGNMTKEELASLQEELKHFQIKIEKHRFFEEKLKHSQSKMDHMANTNEHEHFESRVEIHKSLENKVDDLSKKISKIHKTLSNKLGSEDVLNHREL